ncbi:MAG: Mu-like prophage protein [Microbacterium sp.]|nr:Mu-like prophage protein [Microbacterium sp.]
MSTPALSTGTLVAVPSSAAVSAAADTLAGVLDGLDDAVTDVTTTWSGLNAVYEAPEAQTAYGAMAPLPLAVDELTTALSSAVTALRTYAETLTSLETRRASLLTDLQTVDEQSELPMADRDPDAPTSYEVDRTRALFETDVTAADQECARALRALCTSASWVMNDGLEIVNGNAGSAAQGLAAELLTRYRGTLMVPGPGALLPDEITLTAGQINPTWPRSLIDGQVWVQRPSGAWMLESNLLPDTPPRISGLPGWNGQPQFAPDSVGTPPAWAGRVGKGLGLLGAGLTYWSVYGESYNDTLTRHPEWSEDQRQEEAAVDTLVIGSSSVAGGAGGAWGGALLGASIGSIFPGPGTVIGGVIGGVVGGVLGGWGGQEIAQDVMDDVRQENVEIMAPGPIGVEPEAQGNLL